MKTRVPETITCVNCTHNVVIKLYEVDTTINSAQGHFHILHNPTEPAYTVYCINCGHFMTNDPDHAAPKPKTPGSTPSKRATPGSSQATQSRMRIQKNAGKAAAAGKADKHKATVTTSAAKPRQKPAQARPKTQTQKPSPMKQPRTQRKKAK